jgi:hypothetical protein
MKALDVFRQPVGSAVAERASFQSYVNDVIKFQGQTYGGALPGFSTLYGANPAEPIGNSFEGYCLGMLMANPVVWAVELKRYVVFSQARMCFQQLRANRPGKLFGTPALDMLNTPWPGGTTQDLLARMLLHADTAGNAYPAALGGEVVLLRPDWCELILKARMLPIGPGGSDVQVGWRKVGLAYYEGGLQNRRPAILLPDEFAHFAPYPDPTAIYRGMSWMTPVIREVQADGAASEHKKKFFENAATPNLAVSLPKEIGPEAFEEFRTKMDMRSKGFDNAYKTLYTGGGADVTVIGTDMRQLDFKSTQGAGETRIANAAGVPAVVAGLSEGMQGSSLNAGNYNSAKRSFADTTLEHLWGNAAGSLQVICPAPSGARLWHDKRDIPFLRDDEKDLAEIESMRAATIRTLTDAGFTPGSVVDAVDSEDITLLVHSGLFSVQLQDPVALAAAAKAAKTPPALPAK